MARKARHRISYVLPLANSPGGHRLGVNGLAIDRSQSILYSGGRDGLLCAWNLNLDLRDPSDPFASEEELPPDFDVRKGTIFRQQVQAHTHWINDILIAQDNTAVVSASSDLTVKVWRPHSQESAMPSTIGLHSDYVKCLTTAGKYTDWVASGGLDHKIRLWDLDGHGQRLELDTGGGETSAKGSVYALRAQGSIIASGGPECIVSLWDSRTAKRITRFVGHTDNIRDILISQDGDTVMTASSDQTIKVWSVTAGRCMYNLTMHNDSVWSLYSDHPELSLFYSADRSGLVAKTDVRRSEDMDEGLSVAVAQEHDGVNKFLVAEDHIWTATSSSSINRWSDVDTTSPVQTPEQLQKERVSGIVSQDKLPPSPRKDSAFAAEQKPPAMIPLACVLRVSNNAPLPGQKFRESESTRTFSIASARRVSEAVVDTDLGLFVPYHDLPEATIEGQNGLIKHVLLNDRRRVLTLDTAGEVTMWDLLKCIPVQSFGKKHLEDVTPEVNTIESIANWCGVDTRTGRLAVALEENFCFDAEMYADEWEVENPADFKEDQRINLGKWILRFLFANLIDEELIRDEHYRKNLLSHNTKTFGLHREKAPVSISLPLEPIQKSTTNANDSEDDVVTPKASAVNGVARPSTTPGLSIAAAPNPANNATANANSQTSHLPSTTEERNSLEKHTTQNSHARLSTDKPTDLFSTSAKPKTSSEALTSEAANSTGLETTQAPAEGEKDEKHKEGSSLFGKKFRMNFPKKLGRNSTDTKPATVDEKAEESDKSDDKDDKSVQDNFFGVIQKIRHEYDEHVHNKPQEPLISGITPSMLNETPMLRPPFNITVIINEEKPDSGGVADLYRGTVSKLGQDADLIEKTAPTWLGDLLLHNRLPPKEIAKVAFILLPYQDSLPSIASQDGNNRLNANRMLRAKKILAYVAERIETLPAQPEPDALKPEEYLELLCHDQVVGHNTTLATLRTHLWKTGGDVVLYYKSNGRKPEIGELVKKTAAAQEATAKTGPVVNHAT